MSQSDWTEKEIRLVVREKLDSYPEIITPKEVAAAGACTHHQLNRATLKGTGPTPINSKIHYKSFFKSDVIDWIVKECTKKVVGKWTLGKGLLLKYQQEKEALNAISQRESSENQRGFFGKCKAGDGGGKASEASGCDSLLREKGFREKEKMTVYKLFFNPEKCIEVVSRNEFDTEHIESTILEDGEWLHGENREGESVFVRMADIICVVSAQEEI